MSREWGARRGMQGPLAWAAAVLSVLAVVALAGCSGGSDATEDSPARVGASAEASGRGSLQYEPVALTEPQWAALNKHAYGLMFAGRIPEDVGMVAAPQPPGLADDQVVIAVGWGNCGGSEPLGEARLEGGEVVVEVVDHPKEPGSLCAGMVIRRGIRVDLPDGVTAKEVSSVSVRRRPAG